MTPLPPPEKPSERGERTILAQANRLADRELQVCLPAEAPPAEVVRSGLLVEHRLARQFLATEVKGAGLVWGSGMAHPALVCPT